MFERLQLFREKLFFLSLERFDPNLVEVSRTVLS